MTPTTPAQPTALVTGASRGLRAAIAPELAAAGHPVAVTYASSHDAAHAVVEAITDAGGRAEPYPTDVTDPRAVTALVEAVSGDLGPVGVLVLNATGPQPQVVATELEVDDVRAQLAHFVDSPVLMLRAVLPAMRVAGWGRVVHISSDDLTPYLATVPVDRTGQPADVGGAAHLQLDDDETALRPVEEEQRECSGHRPHPGAGGGRRAAPRRAQQVRPSGATFSRGGPEPGR